MGHPNATGLLIEWCQSEIAPQVDVPYIRSGVAGFFGGVIRMTVSELIAQLHELEAEGFGDNLIQLRLNKDQFAYCEFWMPDYYTSTIVDTVYYDGRHVVVEG